MVRRSASTFVAACRPVPAREHQDLLALLRREAAPHVVERDGDSDGAGTELAQARHGAILVRVVVTGAVPAVMGAVPVAVDAAG